MRYARTDAVVNARGETCGERDIRMWKDYISNLSDEKMMHEVRRLNVVWKFDEGINPERAREKFQQEAWADKAVDPDFER